jgi:hypothetical protein
MRLDKAYHLLGEVGGMGFEGDPERVPAGMVAIGGAGSGDQQYTVAVPAGELEKEQNRGKLQAAATAIVQAWVLEHIGGPLLN